MWVGIDDTDSLKGGCTTYVATELVDKLKYDLIGFPRLVRLNPNIPWKTRGNGAIALQIGIGGGKKIEIGEINGRKIYCYSYKRKEANLEEIVSIIDEVVSKNAMKDADPAFVICQKKLPYWIYKKAVKEILSKEEVEKELQEKAFYKYYRKGRGMIGAAAAIAWKPRDRTYELITYGSEKWIDKESVIKMDKSCKSTFNNYDYENDYLAILPKANSPVFYGIRGENFEELKKAKEMLVTAKEERWLIFETNQATDEHLQKKKIKDVKPYESVIVKGIVKKEPHVIKGGHVVFSIYDENEIDCTAYEPTKQFRNIIKQLRKGDEVIVYGGVREKPFTINIEKIEVKRLAEVYEKVENPVCRKCGKHMKSIGKGKGYRCPICGTKADEKDAKYVKVERDIKPGFYEVPVIAMRHLTKPLKRIKKL
ncbi:MAG: DNA-binding protein [Thermoplasmata archaeon]|nr:MAG: DNA-binding protein [Thermoplasmata archaeon]